MKSNKRENEGEEVRRRRETLRYEYRNIIRPREKVKE
jgi:hypothetical protein